MKKLLMLCLAVFALSATSFAQVEAPVKTATKKDPILMKKKRGMRNDSNTAAFPTKKNSASTPEARSEKIVKRLNERLVSKDPSLALDDQQTAALTAVYRQRQMKQQERPTLETEADKIAYKEARRAASKEFKSKLSNILTKEQAEVYFGYAKNRKPKKAVGEGTKSLKETKKSSQF